MTEAAGYPWFATTLGLADLRRQDRVLLVAIGALAHVRAVAGVIGSRGSLTVVEPARALAEEIAALEYATTEVLALSPTGSERFGAFDVVLSCPLGMPGWPTETYAELLRSNLRPGGRFVLDLPGPDMVPDLTAAWTDLGADAGDLLPLRGPEGEPFATQLQAAGMRSVHAALGAHLLDVPSPHDLAAFAGAALRLSPGRQEELGVALAHRLRTTAAGQTLVHRTRVHGLR